MFSSSKETFKEIDFFVHEYQESARGKEIDCYPNQPTMELWKDLCAILTPPRSPQHEPQTGLDMDIMLNLSLVSDKLDAQMSPFSSQHSCDSDMWDDICLLPMEENLQANLIQDCMWSAPGLAAAGLATTDASLTKLSPDTSVGSIMRLSCASLDIDSEECVDPAAVFPYPLNDTKKLPSLGIETPSESEDTADDDDDDNEEEEEEIIDVVSVSEHQLDSMHSRRKSHHHNHQHSSNRQHTLSLSPSSSMSAQVAAMHNYSSHQPAPTSLKVRLSYSAPQTPTSSSSPRHHHIPSSSLKRSYQSSSSPVSPQQQHHSKAKRQKLVQHVSGIDWKLQRVAQRLKMSSSSSSSSSSSHHHHHHHHHRSSGGHRSSHHGSSSSHHASRSSSDSEDCEGKRAQHNVLERKRRNDLKSNFLRLRDHVPDISSQERAPKVVILKKSADYIASLAHGYRQLELEREHQLRRQERLKRRIADIRREAASL